MRFFLQKNCILQTSLLLRNKRIVYAKQLVLNLSEGFIERNVFFFVEYNQ